MVPKNSFKNIYCGPEEFDSRGSNIDLAGCGIGHKIKVGRGLQEILRAGYGMIISWQDWDVLTSISGMRDTLENDGGMRDLNVNSK